MQDRLPKDAVRGFASLGSWGRHPSNQERDLHVWLKPHFGLKLEPYFVPMSVYVPWLHLHGELKFMMLTMLSHACMLNVKVCWGMASK